MSYGVKHGGQKVLAMTTLRLVMAMIPFMAARVMTRFTVVPALTIFMAKTILMILPAVLM